MLTLNLSIHERTERAVGVYRSNERVASLLLLLTVAWMPYLAINEASAARPAMTLHSSLDALIPYRPGWEYAYAALYLMWFMPFTIVRDLGLLRRVEQAYLATYVVAYAAFLLQPVRIIRPALPPATTFLAWGLHVIARFDGPYNCFPSIHVAIAIIVAYCAWKTDRRLGYAVNPLSVAVIISTLTLKQHYVADVVGGVLLGGGTCQLFLAPYQARPDTALPVRDWFTVPTMFALVLATLYGCYLFG